MRKSVGGSTKPTLRTRYRFYINSAQNVSRSRFSFYSASRFLTTNMCSPSLVRPVKLPENLTILVLLQCLKSPKYATLWSTTLNASRYASIKGTSLTKPDVYVFFFVSAHPPSIFSPDTYARKIHFTTKNKVFSIRSIRPRFLCSRIFGQLEMVLLISEHVRPRFCPENVRNYCFLASE